MGRRGAWTGLLAGVLLAAAAGSFVWADQRDSAFGSAPEAAISIDAPATGAEPEDTQDSDAAQESDADAAPSEFAPSQEPGSDSSSAGQRRWPEVQTSSGRVEDLPAVSRAQGLAVERLGIEAAVVDAGLEPDGAMEIPDDVNQAGLWKHGPKPGEPQGRAVIAAHVDSREQGKGAFFPLREAAEGDRITVSLSGGETVEYEVSAKARYAKDELPIAELFRDDGDHQLVLITCGGAFDEQTRSYEENIVVIADVVS